MDDFASLTPEKIDALKEQADKAYEGLIYELDMAKAMADADLVIESLSEDPKAKIEFYQAMAPLLPEKTVVVTNSSTMLPSTFASYTGRPENIWRFILQTKSGKTIQLKSWDIRERLRNTMTK